MCKIKAFLKRGFSKTEEIFLYLFVALSIFAQGHIWAASTVGDIGKKLADQFGPIATVVKYGAFLLGLYLVVTGFNDMRQTREKQTTVGACLIKVAIGFILCSVIFAIEVGVATLGGSEVELKQIL